jgi:hypothetical protein
MIDGVAGPLETKQENEMNTNLLDQVVDNATQPAPVAAPVANAHSFEKGARITDSGARHVEMLAEKAYRGCGKDVRVADNNPKAVQSLAGLDWKLIPMPLAIQGKTEVRPYPGMVALVRSDNGDPLAVASDSYKPHQNAQLIGTMCKFADEAGLKLSRVGTFNHGSRGFAVATSGVNREAGVGDVVSMHVVLKFGHAPGTATTILVFANELRCCNGVCITVENKARFVHSAELTPDRVQQAREFVMAAAGAFDGHVAKLTMLRKVRSNKGLDLMQLAQLFQPELAAEMSRRLQTITSATAEVDHEILGARVLSALLERDASTTLVSNMISRHADRLLHKVIEATVRQPGGEMTVGTMAHAFSGVTNFNSNVRGRSAETGIEANLFGTSQQDSQKALELAVQVAERVRGLN